MLVDALRTGGEGDFRLVIFDCDGVLVDSEPISLSVLREFVSRSGVALEEDEARDLFLGVSLRTTCDMLRDRFDIVWTEEDKRRMRDTLYSRFRTSLTAVPGVAEVLDALALPYCVASSSQPERIRLSLGVVDLLDRFEPHIFSATMVSQGKPAPDLFLLAAETMGAAPERCLVVEDSPAGIEAAKRAGMTVFAFTGGAHTHSPHHLAAIRRLQPHLIFDSMPELPSLIARTA